MNIPVQIAKKEYRITGDLNQYIINEVATKDGKETLIPRWYYQSLSALFAALLHKKVRTSTASTLQELKSAIEQAEKEILSAFDIPRRGDVIASMITTK